MIDSGRWISYDEYRLTHPGEPYFTRGILPNELVFDFDMDWVQNVKNSRKLIKSLKANKIPYWMAYSGGKGLHIHVIFDKNSLEINKAVISKAQDELVDIDKTIRVALWKHLIVLAKVDKKLANLDFGKVNFSSEKKGSMIREFGTPRTKDGVTTFKTLINEIPDEIPKPEELILAFPGAPNLWDVAEFTKHMESKIIGQTLQYKKNAVDVSLDDINVTGVYCINRFITDGLESNQPTYYATYSIARCCHDLKLPYEKADQAVTGFLDKCNLSDDDRKVRHDNALNGYENDDHHLSCESVKGNYGDEYCSKTCEIYLKRSTVQNEVPEEPITSEIIQEKLKSIPVDEDILKRVGTALGFIEKELKTLDKPSRNAIINGYIKDHFGFTAVQAREIITAANKKPQKEVVIKSTVSDYNKYFVGNSFVPKLLADELLSELDIITLQDTREIALYDTGVFKTDIGEDSVKKESLKRLDMEFKICHNSEVVEYIKLNTLFDRKQLDPEPYLINLRNGMYDVLNDKLLPHDPEYKSSIQVNINYDPAAECPVINKFLNEIVECEDVLPLIQFAGYCFTTDIKMQKAGLLVGNTENGKSTFFDMLSHAIGQENIAEKSIQGLNTDKFAKGQLKGKLVNIFPDLPQSKLYDNSAFKMITSDKYLDGEDKYVKGFRFKNVTKQFYSVNQAPELNDPDEEAFFRRLMIFLFPNSFSGDKADKDLPKKLTTDEEMSGFFNLAMVGLRALLKYEKFAYLRSVDEIKKLYLIKSDPISSFLNECVCFSETDYSKQALYEDYEDWCKLNNTSKIVKNNIFAKKLLKLGYEDYRESSGSRYTVWKNITPVRVGVGNDDRTLTFLNKPLDIYFDLIRQGSKVIEGIVVVYEKLYTHYYTMCVKNNIYEVTMEPLTLTDGIHAVNQQPDNGKNPSRLKSNPDGSLTDSKMTTCDYCKKLFPEDEITTDPSGKKWICHTCQIELISKNHAKINQPISTQLDAVKLVRDTINNLSEGGITKISDTIIEVGKAGITEDRFASYINQMKREGSVFEPCEGFLKCV